MTAPMPAYLISAEEFQKAARDIAAAASSGDLGEVSSAYMTIVESGMQCHRGPAQAIALSPAAPREPAARAGPARPPPR